MQPHFPFSAIVGQDALKRALLLGVIQPSLGGVLVRGTKGVAKSTAVRALAGLLPPITTVAGCPLQRRPGEEIVAWPLPANAQVVTRPVPLVELPLGATEDRVLGSLHLEKALRGERAFEPGLLASANRGILYIDEVNLLADHLVDVLLDAAAGGIHRLERESLSVAHPSRFLLVGTMNPEEGDLRPQLLDRFGLVVDVGDLTNAESRAEAVGRRLAYEADPAAFAAFWKTADEEEGRRVVRAQELLPRVLVPAAVMQALTQRCLDAGAAGLRADLALCKAVCAWAAYQGRTEVELVDLDAVAEFALAHRRTQPPEPPPDGRPSTPQRERETPSPNWRGGASGPAGVSQVLSPSGIFTANVQPSAQRWSAASAQGRWRRRLAQAHGPAAGTIRPYQEGAAISWAATARAAAPRQNGRREGDALVIRSEDLHGWPRRGPAGCLLLFVADASGSMAAWQRMRQTKAAILSLLVQAYQHRDRVALLAFRGAGTELVLPPTQGLERARRAVERLPVGGATPLAEGLAAARRLILAETRRRPRQPIWTVVLTDGRANAAAAGDPWQVALLQARNLAASAATFLVIDTETGPCRFGRAAVLADALGANCVPLAGVLGRPLPDRWRRAV